MMTVTEQAEIRLAIRSLRNVAARLAPVSNLHAARLMALAQEIEDYTRNRRRAVMANE